MDDRGRALHRGLLIIPNPSLTLPALCPVDRLSQNAQRIELHLLSLLRAGGCGERIVKPLGVFRYAGEWDDDPQDRARRWYKCKVRCSAPACCRLAF